MKNFSIITLMMLVSTAKSTAQTYFPPLTGSSWENVSYDELGWCGENVDTLLQFAESRNTKALLILVNGRMALEAYMNGHNQGSLWYWASAAKTITATLTGVAQQEGHLHIGDPVSQYLGPGWTQCSEAEETERTIWHQLTMTSSFDDNALLWNCIEPPCFQCTGASPGTQWHYHNGVYRKLIEVIEAATGESRQSYTSSRLGVRIGMAGIWDDNVFYSNARGMARFGLLALNHFVWNGDSILTDPLFAEAAVTTSQQLNKSYGYLWWINGQESYYRPLIPLLIPGPIVPAAPADMYCGLGADDQKVYVVPSLNMVVVRMGEPAYASSPALSGFDNELWELIMHLSCDVTPTIDSQVSSPKLRIFPNPAQGELFISEPDAFEQVVVFDSTGRQLAGITTNDFRTGLLLEPGIYMLAGLHRNGYWHTGRAVVVR